MQHDIERMIPHRPPFLLIDKIISLDATMIAAESRARADSEIFSRVFAGHYPGNPIAPGVLLCEMVFQAGAVLLSHRIGGKPKGAPVLVRIRDARFKRAVRPDEPLVVHASFVEQVSNAFYMKGSVICNGKTAVRVEFTCALMPENTEQDNTPS